MGKYTEILQNATQSNTIVAEPVDITASEPIQSVPKGKYSTILEKMQEQYPSGISMGKEFGFPTLYVEDLVGTLPEQAVAMIGEFGLGTLAETVKAPPTVKVPLVYGAKVAGSALGGATGKAGSNIAEGKPVLEGTGQAALEQGLATAVMIPGTQAVKNLWTTVRVPLVNALTKTGVLSGETALKTLSKWFPEDQIKNIAIQAGVDRAAAEKAGKTIEAAKLAKVEQTANAAQFFKEQGTGLTKPQITGRGLKTQNQLSMGIGGEALENRLKKEQPLALQKGASDIIAEPLQGAPSIDRNVLGPKISGQIEQILAEEQTELTTDFVNLQKKVFSGTATPSEHLAFNATSGMKAMDDAAAKRFKPIREAISAKAEAEGITVDLSDLKKAAQEDWNKFYAGGEVASTTATNTTKKILNHPAYNPDISTTVTKLSPQQEKIVQTEYQQFLKSNGMTDAQMPASAKEKFLSDVRGQFGTPVAGEVLAKKPETVQFSFQDVFEKRSEMEKELRTLGENGDKTGVGTIRRYVAILSDALKTASNKVDMGDEWKNITKDYQSVKAVTNSDLAMDIMRAAKTDSTKIPSMVTASPEAARIGKEIFGPDNWKQIQGDYFDGIIDSAKNVTTGEISGKELLKKVNKIDSNTFKAVLGDEAVAYNNELRKIAQRSIRIENSPLRKKLGKVAEILKNNPADAADSLMTKQDPELIRVAQKVLNKEDFAQFQSRAIENILSKSSKKAEVINGEVPIGEDLLSAINNITDTTWKAAFPGDSQIKAKLTKLAQAATAIQAKGVGDKNWPIKSLEQIPVLAAGYALYHQIATGTLSASKPMIDTAMIYGGRQGIKVVEKLITQSMLHPDTSALLLKAMDIVPNTTANQKIIQDLAARLVASLSHYAIADKQELSEEITKRRESRKKQILSQ